MPGQKIGENHPARWCRLTQDVAGKAVASDEPLLHHNEFDALAAAFAGARTGGAKRCGGWRGR